MSDHIVQQIEETEVLLSIYDGDENFKQVNPTTYQYKYTEGAKAFILEVIWGPEYPTVKPTINVDLFYNQFILQTVKDKILAIMDHEAELWMGCAVTYTLFERLKEKIGDLLAEQVAQEELMAQVERVQLDDFAEQVTKKPTDKRELTKAQKRRVWDRGEERSRGSDLVDIVRFVAAARLA